MADSREIGMRVGAAANQASAVVAALITSGTINAADIVDFQSDLTNSFLANMQGVQARLEGGTAPVVAPQVQQAVAQAVAPQQYQTVDHAAEAVGQAFAGTTVAAPAATGGAAGYNTVFSGSNKPLDISTPGLDAWLVAQATAVGVDKVWDNRGKPNFIQAINSGNPKTPPPFRSATEGIDKSFWPPSN